LETQREHGGNILGMREKWEKKSCRPTPPPPNLKGKKSKAPSIHAWVFPLAA